MTDLDQTTFAAEVQAAGPDLDPVRANLLLAREIAYAGLRLADSLERLNAVTAQARAAVPAEAPPLERAARLTRFLSDQAGYHGNYAAYTDPRNSFLNEVLERRLGLPISLSVLFVAVARGLGLAAFGVGLPGHFIAGVTAAGQQFWVDLYGGAADLQPADCLRLVRQATGFRGEFDPRWLTPTPGDETVARMLNNLRNSYTTREDWPHAIRVLDRLVELQPEHAPHRRDLGMLHFKAGAYQQASQHLGDYLALAPEAPDAATVRQSRRLLLNEIARLN